MNKFVKIIIALVIILRTNVFPGENDLSVLLATLDQTTVQKQTDLIAHYSGREQEFRESYTLTANLRLLGLRIGRMHLGEVTISSRDSFSISYDPPFDKWDTRYLSCWLNDSLFADEVSGSAEEQIVYARRDSLWVFKAYRTKSPRKTKQAIFLDGLTTPAVNLIEFTRLLYRRRFDEISDVLFMAECYPIVLTESPVQASGYRIFDLKWNVTEGEERVRLHGVHLIGLETADHFIPVAGILNVTFVGLLDLNVTGIIKEK